MCICYAVHIHYIPTQPHTYISAFPKLNRALAGLSAEFSDSCVVVAFLFFLLPQLFIVRTHYALSILLLCSVFAYVMFHVSLYFFYRVIFCYFLFVSDIQTISSMQTLFSLKFGAYFFCFQSKTTTKSPKYVLSSVFHYSLLLECFTTNSNVFDM